MTGYSVDVIDLGELPREDWEVWRRHHAARRDGAGMCESPDFLVPLAQVIGHCRAVRIRDGAETVGYIPIYQPFGPSFAFPIPMCDYQSVALFKSTRIDFHRILQQAGICRWKYENLTECNGLSEISHRFARRSVPVIQLGGSFSEYLGDRARGGTKFQSIKKLSRRLAREVGNVSVVRPNSNEEFIDRLLEYKQHRQPEQQPFDRFVRRALLRFAESQNGEIRGAPYVLMAGDDVLALSFLLEADDHAFGWFCGYEPRFAKYSPGSLLLLKVIEEMHVRKFKAFDLGPGGEPWKERFATGHRTACLGHIYSYKALGSLEDKVSGVVRTIRSTLRS